jgi:hypothetical protein
MTGFPLTRAAAVLTLAGLAATASPFAAAQAAAARPGAPAPATQTATRTAPAAAGWAVRTVLPEGIQARGAEQVISTRLGADFSLVPLNRPGTRFQLRMTRLAGGATTAGPVFRVSSLRLASGYLWVYGPVYGGPHGNRVRLVLHEVSVPSLRLIRSWTLLPTRRLASLSEVAVTPGPGPRRTVWVGFRRTLRLISASTGATLRRARVPAGFSITDVASDEIAHRLYVAATPRLGGGAVFEYQSRSGLLLASATGKPVEFAVAGSSLTAVPGRVWSSFRTGMLGQTVLLRARDLSVVPLHQPIFGWAMFASTVFGGSLWLARQDGVIACIGPQTGAVRARATLPALRDSGQLLTVDPDRHLVYALGQHGVVAISAPDVCWG